MKRKIFVMLTVISLNMTTIVRATADKPITMSITNGDTIIEIPIIDNTEDHQIPNKNGAGNRSISESVCAFYYISDQEVEINCFNIGITNVTLYGPMGIPVDTYTFDSNSEPMVVLSVPSDSGTYRIVIDADKYSGEGEFEVR